MKGSGERRGEKETSQKVLTDGYGAACLKIKGVCDIYMVFLYLEK